MNSNLFSIDAYQFDLPSELIAQYPVYPRDHSRLMIVDRQSGQLSEIRFAELRHFLQSGDSLVFNNTKVLPARLIGKRETGGIAEIFLTKKHAERVWDVLAKPGKKLQVGATIDFGPRLVGKIEENLNNGLKRIRFEHEGIFEELLSDIGLIPLPPYIRKGKSEKSDHQDYQTVFASAAGAVAAPTAGLHFTESMLEDLKQNGVEFHFVTLHVGLGTFKPVQTHDIRHHQMHSESYFIDAQAASQLNLRKPASKRICVGTTTCRALESAFKPEGHFEPGSYDTSIFIYPGYKFKVVDSLLTNFHLPGSSLLMMISAFAGYELIKEAYQKAIAEKFRFYSYGDAMLII